MTTKRRAHKVLLVEDDYGTQRVVTEALRQIDVVVEIVNDGRDAIPRALDVLPDLVLLDIALPGMNGWEILAELRALDDTANVPVIIITAHGQSGWETAAYERGADLFIEKPFRIAMLIEAVARMLASGRPGDSTEDVTSPGSWKP